MDKPHCKRLLCACIIVITLLCTFLINAEFIAAHHSEYHNLLNESSFEPVDMEKIKESSAYRIAPPSTIIFPCASAKYPCFMTCLFQ